MLAYLFSTIGCCDPKGRRKNDIYGLGGEHTDVVNSFQYSNTPSIPRATSLASSSQAGVSSPWFYVLEFLWIYVISRC